MSKIDIDRLVADLVEVHAQRTGIDRNIVTTYLDDALARQGLRVNNGNITETQPTERRDDEEWDEDDRRHYASVICFLMRMRNNSLSKTEQETITSDIEWLKSLRDRFIAMTIF